MMQFFYGYRGWVVLAFIIVSFIIVYSFNLIPILNNRIVLFKMQLKKHNEFWLTAISA